MTILPSHAEGFSRDVILQSATRSAICRPDVPALAATCSSSTARVASSSDRASCPRPRGRSRAGRPAGSSCRRGGRRGPRRSCRRGIRNHSVPRSSRFSPDFGIAPGHRPLDHDLVALLDPVLEVPLAVDLADAEARRICADPLGALVRAEARVVVDRVLGEVGGDQLGVARVQRLVVGADVIEVAHARPSGTPATGIAPTRRHPAVRSLPDERMLWKPTERSRRSAADAIEPCESTAVDRRATSTTCARTCDRLALIGSDATFEKVRSLCLIVPALGDSTILAVLRRRSRSNGWASPGARA